LEAYSRYHKMSDEVGGGGGDEFMGVASDVVDLLELHG
jgi:hypothetical protein